MATRLQYTRLQTEEELPQPQQEPVQPLSQQEPVQPQPVATQPAVYPAQPLPQPEPVQPQPVAMQPAVYSAQPLSQQGLVQPQPVAMQPAVYPAQPLSQPGSVQPQPVAMQMAVYPAQPGVPMQPAPQLPGVIPHPPQQALVQTQPTTFNYKPNDYYDLSVVTAVLCGMFSPITLVCSIIALLLASKSHESTSRGDIKEGHNYGIIAAYLNFTACTSALVVACLITGLAAGFYRFKYY